MTRAKHPLLIVIACICSWLPSLVVLLTLSCVTSKVPTTNVVTLRAGRAAVVMNVGLEAQEDDHAKELELALALREGASWLVAGRLPMYNDALLNVEGKEMPVLRLIHCQGP